MLLDHDRGHVLADTADGTLTVREDEVGLRAESVVTDPAVIEGAKKGLLKGWSFNMKNVVDSIEDRANQLPIRHVKDFDMDEITLVMNKIPVYSSTSVEVRAGTEEEVETRAMCMETTYTENLPPKKEYDNTKFQERINKLKKQEENKRNKFKKLAEQRAQYEQQLQQILDKAEQEERALNDEEMRSFNDLEKKIKDIDDTIAAEQRARDILKKPEETEDQEEKDNKETEDQEERAFANYIRGIISEERASNLTSGDNGAVIPTSIANKIIKKVYEICPIYQLATRYDVGGTLSIPYYNEETTAITMAYATEFSELESNSGKFKSIELKGFLAGALTKVSKSLVNNSQFDITNFVVNQMAENIARWIENELLNGTADKVEGVSKAKQVVTAAAGTAITGDELIDLQETVPDVFQPSCIWIMNKATRTAIRKLKNSDGDYILQKDATAKWGYTLFGNDVFCSDNMPKMAAGKTAIIYGDMSGLAVKVSEDMNIEVLREKFATEHAIGVVGWLEMDSKIENEQKIAVLKMKAAD